MEQSKNNSAEYWSRSQILKTRPMGIPEEEWIKWHGAPALSMPSDAGAVSAEDFFDNKYNFEEGEKIVDVEVFRLGLIETLKEYGASLVALQKSEPIGGTAEEYASNYDYKRLLTSTGIDSRIGVKEGFEAGFELALSLQHQGKEKMVSAEEIQKHIQKEMGISVIIHVIQEILDYARFSTPPLAEKKGEAVKFAEWINKNEWKKQHHSTTYWTSDLFPDTDPKTISELYDLFLTSNAGKEGNNG
jgi:hypothetical protein